MKKEIADQILIQVKDDYNRIADIFSSKRDYLSDDLRQLKQYSKKNDRILDLGCGNGRLSELFPKDQFDYLGVDVSAELINIAKNRYPDREFKIVPSITLPFPNNSFDIIYCLAVFHHIPSLDYRQKFLNETNRVLIPSGRLILTTWYIDGANYDAFSQSEETSDFAVPFKDSGGKVMVERFIHAFSEPELNNYLEDANFCEITTALTPRGKYRNLLSISQKR